MYFNITDPLECLDAVEGHFGGCHAEQAAHCYEESMDPDNYNVNALDEIVNYLESGIWANHYHAQEIVKHARKMIGLLEVDENYCPKCGSLFAVHEGDGSCVEEE